MQEAFFEISLKIQYCEFDAVDSAEKFCACPTILMTLMSPKRGLVQFLSESFRVDPRRWNVPTTRSILCEFDVRRAAMKIILRPINSTGTFLGRRNIILS